MTVATGQEPVLAVKKAAKLFGAKLVFKNVTCRLAPGKTLLVAGSNGAGKSTLMQLMAGLLEPSAGSVTCNVEPEKIAYLGHATFIYPGLTALENLRFWASMYGLKRADERIDVALKRVGLARVAEERAGGFSRGMAQRLNLARVFVVEPDLLFLDEPGTGLDVKSRTMLREEITSFRARGASLVWVSHHIEEDRQLADEVLALGGGKVQYQGPADQYAVEGAC